MRLADRRTEIVESWKTVRMVEAQITTNTGGTIFALIPQATGFARIPESLLLVFAVSVLDDALSCLRDEGAFSSPGRTLDARMKASRSRLNWQDFDAVDQVRVVRNAVAHERRFLAEGECHLYLNVIARELLAFGILETDFKGTYSVSMR